MTAESMLLKRLVLRNYRGLIFSSLKNCILFAVEKKKIKFFAANSDFSKSGAFNI